MTPRNAYAKLLRSLGYYVETKNGNTLTYNSITILFNDVTRYVTVYIPYLTAIQINVPYQVSDRLHMRITQHINGISNRVNHFPERRSPTHLQPFYKVDKYTWMAERAAMYKPVPFNPFN